MLVGGSFFLYTDITCACFSLFGKVEVTSEKIIYSLERGSYIVRLQDLNIKTINYKIAVVRNATELEHTCV